MCWADPAERARTALVTASSVRLGIGGPARTTVLGHVVDGDGDVVVAVDERRLPLLGPAEPPVLGTPSVSGTHGVAELVATDLAPVAVPDRVRTLVTLRGPLVALSASERTAARTALALQHPDLAPTTWTDDVHLLRLEPTSVLVAESCRCGDVRGAATAQPVDLGDYMTAQPDPLTDVETPWLCHLADDHGGELGELAALVAPDVASGDVLVRPIGLDRYGLRLRVRARSGAERDVLLAFDREVGCACEANEAINVLFTRASRTC